MLSRHAASLVPVLSLFACAADPIDAAEHRENGVAHENRMRAKVLEDDEAAASAVLPGSDQLALGRRESRAAFIEVLLAKAIIGPQRGTNWVRDRYRKWAIGRRRRKRRHEVLLLVHPGQ